MKRPNDLEALEHGEDIVVYLELFTRRLPSEISVMGTEPPVSRAVPPRPKQTSLIDLEERLNRYLGGSAGEPWTTYPVKHDDEIAKPWHRLTDLRDTVRTVSRGRAGDLRPLGHDATKSENVAASFRGLLVLHEITYG
jgi:hypothetical protein